MSKIESGALELENTVFNFHDTLSSILIPFESISQEKNLFFDVQSDIQSCKYIKGDQTRLQQILNNLLSNALKFTKEGGVTFQIKTIEKDTPEINNSDFNIPGNYQSKNLKIVIEDTGLGISEDRLETIFEAFIQADNSITRNFGGTGLGLTIVKKYITLMEGEIHVKSTIGQGSRFEVTLPVTIVTESEAQGLLTQYAPVNQNDIGPLSILLAEDNPVNALIAIAFLNKFGHEVVQAQNGQEAVEIFEKESFDLVLMDIHMPIMSGIIATQTIRATDRGKNVPIIGLTAEAFKDRHEVFRQAGMNDIMTKPFKEEQLKALIAQNYLRANPASEEGNDKHGNDKQDIVLTSQAT